MRELLEKHKIEVYAAIGLLFAFFLWYMTRKQGQQTQSISIPYLVSQTLQQDTTGQNANASQTPTISEQGNIIGDHPNNQVPNGTIPSFTYNGVPPHGFTPTGNQGYWTLNPSGSWTWSDYHPIAFPTTQPNVTPQAA